MAKPGAGFMLWRVANHWQREQRKVLKSLGATHAQVAVMASVAALDAQRAPTTQSAVAGYAKLDVMMTSQVVRTLTRRGLLSRRDHPKDNRAFVLKLTTKGMKLAEQAASAMADVDQKFFDPLDADSFLEALDALMPTPRPSASA